MQRDVEVPEKPSSDKPQLSVSKILADAVSWAKRERLECCSLVCTELRVVQGVVRTEPSFRHEGIWQGEVTGIVMDGPLVDRDKSLEGFVNI